MVRFFPTKIKLRKFKAFKTIIIDIKKKSDFEIHDQNIAQFKGTLNCMTKIFLHFLRFKKILRSV